MTERRIHLDVAVKNNPTSVLQDVEYVHSLKGKRYVMHPFQNSSGGGKGLYSIRKQNQTKPNAYITLEELAELFAINGFVRLGANIRMKPSDVKYPTSPPALQPTAKHVKADTTLSHLIGQKSDSINRYGLSESLRNKLSSIGIAAADSDVPALKIGAELAESGLDIARSIPNDEQRDSPIATDAQTTLASDTLNLQTAEREAVVKVRFGQGRFREALFKEKEHGEKCWMSAIEGRPLLVASHIKPWSHCEDDPDSRGQRNNGLLLSALWDAAFDAGLVSFDSDWKVVASSELSGSARRALKLNEHMALPDKFRTDGRKEYLAYHRAEVFKYEKKKELQ